MKGDALDSELARFMGAWINSQPYTVESPPPLPSEKAGVPFGLQIGDEVCPVDDLEEGVLVTGVVVGFTDADVEVTFPNDPGWADGFARYRPGE